MLEWGSGWATSIGKISGGVENGVNSSLQLEIVCKGNIMRTERIMTISSLVTEQIDDLSWLNTWEPRIIKQECCAVYA